MINNLKYRIYIFGIIVVFLIYIGLSLFLNLKQNKKVIEKNYIDQIDNKYKITVEGYDTMVDYIFKREINLPAVKRLFYRGVKSIKKDEADYYRKKLYGYLKEKYNLFKEYNYRQLHFHTKENESYLRFHRPDKYGDNLTRIRESVRLVNQNKKRIEGFEEGKIFNGYRFVYPLTYLDKHIGSVEISISFKTIIQSLKKIYNNEYQFILKEDIVKKKIFESEADNYETWWLSSGYLLDKGVSKEQILKQIYSEKYLKKFRETINKKIKKGSGFIIPIKYKSKKEVLIFYPISNIKGNSVGYLINIVEDNRIHQINSYFYYIFIPLILLGILLIVFFVYIYKSAKKINYLATYDSLTKIYTRGVFLSRLKDEYNRYKRYGSKFTIAMIDIDNFKNINDTYGHQKGDEVLRLVVNIFKKNIRKTDFMGRYGGDELTICFTETGSKNIDKKINDLKKKISERDILNQDNVTVSIGLKEIDEDVESIDDLIKICDEYLYRAKKMGKNLVFSG